jgi:phosphodiesterase/alkaline phosphatase D-like protein
MTGLTPGATVFYQIGSPDGVSATTSFNATRTDYSPEAPLRIAWFGDLGVDNAQALPFIQAEAAQGVFDHVVHVGDYACKYRDCRTPLPPARL